MFSGLIASRGTVVERRAERGGQRLILDCSDVANTAKTGDSVAINGVCLTVASIDASKLQFDVVPETLERSNLGGLAPGDEANVEASLRLGEPLGGHLVYGHVDAATRILRKIPEGPGYRLWCEMPPGLGRLIVEKGYVALDGVSLTVAETAADRFAVALVPETLARTTLGTKGAGAALNVEVDPVARYVAAALEQRK